MTREEAIEFAKEQLEIFGKNSTMYEFLEFSIKALEERPKGEWIMNNLAVEEWMCSVCHEKFDDIPTCMGEPLYKFCPECGADLRGEA